MGSVINSDEPTWLKIVKLFQIVMVWYFDI